MTIKVVPGILEQKREEAVKKLIQAAGFCEEVLVDIIDGKLIDNQTIDLEDLADINGEISLGAHLMVAEPLDWIESCAEAGVDKAIAQIELMSDQKAFVKAAKEKEIVPGLALDLKTAVDFLDEEAVEEVEEMLLMGVPLGFSGQSFDRKVLEKIRILRGEWQFKGNLWIDGGLNQETISLCAQAGANCFSVTSAIWGAKDPKAASKQLQQIATKAGKDYEI